MTKKFDKNIVKNYGALRSCFWGDFGKKLYQKKINILNKKFGNYILIVSNFPTYNSYVGKNKLKELQVNFRGYDPNQPDLLHNNEKKIFNQYVKLAKILSKQLNKTVIIRPHPGESLKGWKESIKDLKNVFVEKEGELLTWILGSDFIIQNNCTSAIEASASNIPVITYVDDKKDLTILSEGTENIPNKLSLNTFGEEKFIETVKNINLFWNENKKKHLREIILNKKLKDYGTINAAKNIAQEIIEYIGLPNPKGNQNLGKDSILYDIHELFRNFKYKLKFQDNIIDMNKRHALTIHKLQKDIFEMLNIMKINKNIKIKRVERNTFYLYPLQN